MMLCLLHCALIQRPTTERITFEQNLSLVVRRKRLKQQVYVFDSFLKQKEKRHERKGIMTETTKHPLHTWVGLGFWRSSASSSRRKIWTRSLPRKKLKMLATKKINPGPHPNQQMKKYPSAQTQVKVDLLQYPCIQRSNSVFGTKQVFNDIKGRIIVLCVCHLSHNNCHIVLTKSFTAFSSNIQNNV